MQSLLDMYQYNNYSVFNGYISDILQFAKSEVKKTQNTSI